MGIAKGLADEELDIQREALKQAEINNQAEVEEAFKFSEAQAKWSLTTNLPLNPVNES